MTMTVAEMRLLVTGDGSDADKTLDKTGKKVDGFQKRVGGLGKSLTGTAALSAVSFVGITGPILGLGLATINSASDQEEALNKVNVVYGDNSKAITDWAGTSATAMGMTETQALDTAGTLGNIYTAMGFNTDEASQMSQQFIGLSADLGSFNNVPTPEALQAIQSGLVGEYEPLKRFGVVITEDKVKMKALEMGLGDANGELTEQEKVLARQQLIWEQTSNAHGDFAETSDSLSNSTKILKAQLGNLSAEIGSVLLPFVQKVIGGLVGFLAGVGKLSPGLKTFIVVLGLLAAAAGPILIAISMMIPAFGVLGAVIGAIFSPIGLIVGALILLGVAYKKNFLGFGDAVRAVGSKIKSGFNAMLKPVKEFVNGFKRAFSAMEGNPIEKVLKSISAGLKAIGGDNTPRFIVDLARKFDSLADVVGTVSGYISKFTDAFGKFRHSGLDPVSAAVRALGDTFSGFKPYVTDVLVAIDKLKEGFSNVKDAISDFMDGDFSEGFEKLKEGFASIFDGLGDIGGVIKELLGKVDWEGIWQGIKDAAVKEFEALKTAASDLINNIKTAFQNIDWSALWSGVKNIASTIVSGLGDLAGALWNWISTAAASVDWTALLNNAKDIVTGLSSKLGDLGAWAVKWISDAAGRIDWTGLLANAKNIVTGLSGKLGDLAAWAVKWVTDAGDGVDWTAILSKAKNIVTGLSGKLGDLVAWAIKWVTDAGNAVDWKLILSKANNITNGLSGKLGDLIAWVKKWISDATPSFETWKGIIGNVGDVTSAIVEGLGDLGKALLDWVQGAWNSAMEWLDEKKNNVDIFGWKPFGGGDSGGDDSGGGETQINNPPPGMPTDTKWDASGMANSINAAMVAAIGALSGESLAGSLENWIWRAAAIVAGTIADDMMVIARGMDVAILAAFSTFSGASLASTINNWVMLAAGQMGSLLPGPMGVIAVAMDTAFIAAFAGFSGASAAGAISGWLTKAVAIAATQMTVLDTMKTRFMTFVGETTTAITTWASITTTTVSTAMTAFLTSIKGGASDSTSAIGTFTQTTGGDVSAWSGKVKGYVSDAMSTIAGYVQSYGSTASNNMSTAMNAIAEAARSGMATAKTNISNAVSEIPGIISGIGGSAVNTAYSIGVNISDAFARGMESMLYRIEGAAARMVAAADIALRKKAELASPSKLFRRHGRFTGEGYELGILDLIPDVARATEQLVHAGVPDGLAFGNPMVDYRSTPVLPPRSTNNGGNNVYIVMTRSELVDFFDTIDTVKVMTDSAEFSATFGG